MNDYFSSNVKNLNPEHWDKDSNSHSVIHHRNNVNDIIKKYIDHPSIKNVKKKHKNINKFSFCPVTMDEVTKVNKDLKAYKSADG